MSTDVAVTLVHSGNANAGKNVPAFLLKLFNMVNDRSTDDLIKWNTAGDSFLVMRHEDFAKDLLPRYYKHNNFSSFVRQLNMYGFHKIPHIEDNAFSKTESQVWEFSNPYFHRDQPDLLCLVTRKKSGEAGDKDSLDYQTIMSEIQAIKRHQMTISQDLRRIQADNQALWQEQVDTRARHSKHQETIEKILAFLGSVYGNARLEDKSIRPKKRKLLLQHESSDSPSASDAVFQNDRTKETFEDMFRSTSTSPNLKPLRQPTSDIASAKPNGQQTQESRFTLPNFENRQQTATAPLHRQQIRNMNKMKQSPILTTSLPSDLASPIQEKSTDLQARAMAADPPITPLKNLPDANGSGVPKLDPSDPMNPINMQLTPSLQNRIFSNNAKAGEIEQDLALQDQNIQALVSLLGLDPSDLDASALDDNLMNDMGDSNFDDFLNQNASIASTPQSTTNYELNDAILAPINGDHVNGKNGMHPPPMKSYGAAGGPGSIASVGASINPAKISSVVTTPGSASTTSSAAGSVHEEEIEEIDMDKARGKKRKSTG